MGCWEVKGSPAGGAGVPMHGSYARRSPMATAAAARVGLGVGGLWMNGRMTVWHEVCVVVVAAVKAAPRASPTRLLYS